MYGGTRRAAPDKMKAIQYWTENSTKTVTQLESFLGLTQHYAVYMKHYAEWAAPHRRPQKPHQVPNKGGVEREDERGVTEDRGGDG